ncbi:DNA-formamidopyrimidine glycosylase [Mycoplasma mycoides]|uniref:DNA-formamidopyrimidine glycosylase n=1 Tax=Mycoplasma mycoides TaxID=2102 RepID=UPI000347CE93|nr:DNA-formamidopyrimidine glycosylase [Mycoplasma mycoides]EXU60618.1 Formamidopyrimidine-DNA glycosylase [Mycoplasma mycoides subsp. capri PG3]QVK04674.1 DNA-formamidopyrimidine glycosylase [Mycoplasma mycoides subsp. capri]
MPELPEVVTVTNTIKPKIINRTILNSQIFTNKIISSTSVDQFINLTKNQKIYDVYNLAKYIVIELKEHVIISHLRMTGKWVIENSDQYAYKKSWLRAELLLDNNLVFRFYDMRGFGTLNLYNKQTFLKDSHLDKLGPIPLNNQTSVDYLFNKLQKSNKAIKTVLLDQHVISGLGNIYVNEVLFLSKINPLTNANLITKDQTNQIIKNCETVLSQAILLKGTTISDFESLPGITGGYQTKLLVHMNNKNCKICDTKISKIKVNGRGTYYCSKCQN